MATAAALAFMLTGQLQAPPDEGAAPAAVAFGITGNYQSEEGGRLALSGAGTKVVSFGSVPAAGAKAVLVEFLQTTGAAPVQLRLNGGSEDIELSPGGFFALGSPNPVDGITELSIVYTTDVTLRVKLLG